MRTAMGVALCLTLAFCCGCEEKKGVGTRGKGGGMKIRAANVTVRGIDGEVVEDLTLTIDPATVRAKRGDAITWTVSATNNLADEAVVVRAEVTYIASDGATATRATQADLTIDRAIMGLSFRLYVPNKTGYIWDSLAIDGVPAGNPIRADEATQELFLLVELAELPPWVPTAITYTTEVGATTATPAGVMDETPPSAPQF